MFVLANTYSVIIMQRLPGPAPKQILFATLSSFPTQEGPLCYFYALALSIQAQLETPLALSDLPRHCVKIVSQINQEYAEISLQDSSEDTDLDDVVDDIFADNLTDEIIQSLGLISSDEPILTVSDFMGEYPHSYAMGLLLGLKLDASINLKEISLLGLINKLRQFGPMIFDGSYGDMDEQHTILLVGCQQYPTEEIFYVDPNQSDTIQQMPFMLFKEKLINYGHGILHLPTINSQPIHDNCDVITVNLLPHSFFGQKRTSSQAGMNDETIRSDAKKPRTE